jgi:hypothetical protein
MSEEDLKMPLLRHWIELGLHSKEKATTAPVLHHYTDAVGLHGIVSSNVLWATEAQFSNDLSEQQYAIEIARQVIDEVWKGRDNIGEWEQLLRERMTELFTGSFAIFTHPYLVSFREDGDLLSQWRAYSRKSGFSLAFNALVKDGTTRIRCDGAFRTLLRKVIYDPELQRRNLRQLVERFVTLANSLSHAPSSAEGGKAHTELVLIVILEFSDWACTVKHAAFSEEREWRLVALPVPGDPNKSHDAVMIRATPELLLPYVVLKPGEGERLPFTEVRCGPGRLQSESAKAVRVLLRRHGYPELPITTSSIPLRV